MKNAVRISGVILLILPIFLIQSCIKKKPPIISTTVVTAISYTTATSGGEVTDDGGAAVTARGVCWNTSINPTIVNSKTTESGGLGSFISNITQLTPNTMYYVRAYATNSAGIGYGNQVTFTTSQAVVPVLTTTAITSITTTTAVSGGNITADNGGSVTARGVCWGTVTNPTTANNKTTDGTGTGSFVSNLISLQPGTIYYVRSYATNSVGTSYGNEIIFTTTIAVPTLTTTAASSITQNTATSGGNVTNEGVAAVTARGVCWSTSATPNITDSKTTDGTGIGSFTSLITGLTQNITYYVRAYATNSAGTGYGSVTSFTTLNSGIIFNPNKTYGTITDVDGNIYKTITIGTQTWMAENLKVIKYNDNTAIPLVTDNAAWYTLAAPGYCWYNNDAATYKNIYGALYNWYTVNIGKLCPTGWHVPTDTEWTVLTTYLGGTSVAGGKLKEIGTSHWGSLNTGATNETGFTALPGGYRDYLFYNIGFTCYWYSSTQYSVTDASFWGIGASGVFVGNTFSYKGFGASVRCIKDN